MAAGTVGTPARAAITPAPGFSAPPSGETRPSGKIATSAPASSARTASLTTERSTWPRRTGIVPWARIAHPHSLFDYRKVDLAAARAELPLCPHHPAPEPPQSYYSVADRLPAPGERRP